jgi:hypothetical protein
MPLFGLPTLEKNWQFDVNKLVSGTSREDHHREVLFAVKESLINFPLNPWTVAGSNDTVTAGMDAVDRWLDPDTDIKFSVSDPGTGSRSWIVLENVDGVQVLIDCRRTDNPGGGAAGNSARDIFIQFSPSGGYTGGSTTTQPTATDNRTLCSNAWLADINGGATFKVHVLGTTDGATTIVLFTRNNLCTARWIFTKVIDEAAAWTLPYIADASHAATTSETRAPKYSEMFDAETFQGVVSAGGVQFNASLSTWASVNDAIGQRLTVPNDFTGEDPFLPIGVVSTTVGARGRLGRIPDLWFGSAGVITGTVFPADNTYQFAQFGQLIVPWNGTIPEIA